jgi:hypothetical protein
MTKSRIAVIKIEEVMFELLQSWQITLSLREGGGKCDLRSAFGEADPRPSIPSATIGNLSSSSHNACNTLRSMISSSSRTNCESVLMATR